MSAAREAAMRRRTQLFVPANKPRFVTRAAASGADAVILDLEDSVPPDQRPAARAELPAAVAGLREAAPSVHVLVRVNAGESLADDVDAAVGAQADAVLVPKVESPAEVAEVVRLLADAETRHGAPVGRTQVQLLVESPLGILALPDVAASADERVVALMLGIEDLSTELEIDPRSPDFDVRWAHGALLCAARAHGLAPYGLMGSLANFTDLDALADDARRAAAFGYLGALCIHPVQVDVLDAAFSPSEARLAEARAVVAALAEAERTGTSAVQLEGRMIDTPVAARARRLLARAGEA